MHKKLLSTTALLIAAGIAVPAFAQWTMSLGVQSTTMNVNGEMEMNGLVNAPTSPTTKPFYESESSESNQSTGISGELAVGYQFNFNKTYNVALEAFGQLVNTEVEVPVFIGDGDAFSDNHANASFDWIAGLRLRPGFYATPATRLFIDGGIVWGGFEVEYSEGLQSSLEGINTSDPGINSSKDSNTQTGWRYGVGAEHKFTDNFVVGVDYTITEFDEMSAEEAEEAFGSAFGPTSIEYRPTLYTLGLNFKYLFGAKKQPQRRYEMVDK